MGEDIKKPQTLTKLNIVEDLCRQTGLSKKEASEFTEIFFDNLKNSFKACDLVKVSGFGTFLIRQKKDRIGRNPQTGESMVIKGRRVVTFRSSTALKDKVGGNNGGS